MILLSRPSSTRAASRSLTSTWCRHLTPFGCGVGVQQLIRSCDAEATRPRRRRAQQDGVDGDVGTPCAGVGEAAPPSSTQAVAARGDRPGDVSAREIGDRGEHLSRPRPFTVLSESPRPSLAGPATCLGRVSSSSRRGRDGNRPATVQRNVFIGDRPFGGRGRVQPVPRYGSSPRVRIVNSTWCSARRRARPGRSVVTQDQVRQLGRS